MHSNMPMNDNSTNNKQNRQIVGGILNKDAANHDEQRVGTGANNFLDLLNRELEKQGGQPGLQTEQIEEEQPMVNKQKPIKQFLKKGKRDNELKNKEDETRAQKYKESEYIDDVNESMRKEVKESPPKKKPTNNKKIKKRDVDHHEDLLEDGVVDMGESYADNVCYFCGKSDLKSGLDEHFYKECPMLKSCFYCKQIVEISSLSEH